MVGDESFMLLLLLLWESSSNLGGSSKHFGVGFEKLTISVQGLGFPGSSSQPNGTEAEVKSGGVFIPGLSGECIVGGFNKGSFGILH